MLLIQKTHIHHKGESRGAGRWVARVKKEGDENRKFMEYTGGKVEGKKGRKQKLAHLHKGRSCSSSKVAHGAETSQLETKSCNRSLENRGMHDLQLKSS